MNYQKRKEEKMVDLKSKDGINKELSELYDMAKQGQIEAKHLDGANTIIKTAIKLNGELPLKYAMLLVKSKQGFPLDIPLLNEFLKEKI